MAIDTGLKITGTLYNDSIRQEVLTQFTKDAWSEFPGYSRELWACEIAEQNTQRGYWAWVSAQIDLCEEEA